MRKLMWVIALALAATLAPAVLRAANITYAVSETVGAGSVTGSITTDGAIGTLATADIVNWNLILNDGVHATFDLEGPTSGNNSGEAVVGSDLTATATQLLFNFSASDSGYFLLQYPSVGSGNAFVCYISNLACDGSDPGNDVSLSSQSPISNEQWTSLTGTDVIAGASATPEPGSLTLLGVGLLGLMMLRKRLA